MIEQKVVKLLKANKLPFNVELPANQELEIVRDVVYMNGFPLPWEMQAGILKWINDNPKAFADDTRKW
jgi:hypothetical protein